MSLTHQSTYYGSIVPAMDSQHFYDLLLFQAPMAVSYIISMAQPSNDGKPSQPMIPRFTKSSQQALQPPCESVRCRQSQAAAAASLSDLPRRWLWKKNRLNIQPTNNIQPTSNKHYSQESQESQLGTPRCRPTSTRLSCGDVRRSIRSFSESLDLRLSAQPAEVLDKFD